MKFDSSGKVTEVVWNMRLADQERSEDRATLQRLYNGQPPFDATKAEENHNEVNRNFLEGTNLLANARRQWNQAFLSGSKYFTVHIDSGPKHKRTQWSRAITQWANRPLKRSRKQTDLIRAVGANLVLYGIGPSIWPDRHCIVPNPVPLSSLMIPSETTLDFENLEWFATFEELTPTQLYDRTHGMRVDKGWNMPMVQQQLKNMAEKCMKSPSATSYQYMPERVEELIKQDRGFWNTDAVQTIDVWNFFFRECEDGEGWYRRVVLDWGEGGSVSDAISKNGDDSGFLYTSGKRKYADTLSQILFSQFGDCSAVAPFRYQSVRSLGWMLWGVCELQNRLRCRFTEALFEQMMWYFRANGKSGFDRIKKAMFEHMGVIPDGINFVPAGERFTPNANLLQMGFGMNRQLMSENSASFTQDPNTGEGKEMTATETMARVNAVNALVSGMLNLAYTYQEPLYREQCRRLCVEHPRDRMAREFRRNCLKDGVPPEMLDVDNWSIEPVRIMGGGDKTLQMATIQFLNGIRQNMGPQGQRLIDNLSVFAATDQAELAEEIAPLDENKEVSSSTHDAQLATERLLRGLPFDDTPQMVYEEYVQQWLKDMATVVGQIQKTGGMATKEQVIGLGNLAAHISKFIEILASDEEAGPRVKQYQDALGQLSNFVKAFAQRLQEQEKGANGNGGIDAQTQAKLSGELMLKKAKAENLRESHALKTAQRQVQFEQGLKQKEQTHRQELTLQQERMAQEMAKGQLQGLKEPA
jgi:hypothetical protein